MSNVLKMVRISELRRLLALGWSFRRIARALGIHRETVARYAAEAAFAPASPAAPTDSIAGRSGLGGEGEADLVHREAPALADGSSASDSKPAISITGSPGRTSLCAGLTDVIKEKFGVGLSAQRIFQDLLAEYGFAGSYSSVRRFVRRMSESHPLPFRRMECEPGDEAQVDFGQGAYTKRVGAKTRRRPHLLRIVLSFSRRAYSEVVWQQTTEEFIRCIENAFWYFGGIPATLVLDNLKAAIEQADWFDPKINRKFESFCRHYGIVALPAKPRTPRHKGKVEAAVKYAQENAVKGREFEDLAAQNAHLAHWEASVADLRIHGTTRRQVKALFEIEKPKLRPLPTERFPFFHEAPRVVHRDGHVAIDRAFYSAPPEFVGRKVWARWDSRTVRLFDQHSRQIAIHARREAGRFSTNQSHIPLEKTNPVERGTKWYVDRAMTIGPECGRWAQGLIGARGIHGIRALLGLLSLARKHSCADLERVCALSTSHDAFHLKSIRRLLASPHRDERQIEFIETHPLIRDPKEYAEFLHDAFLSTPTT